MSAQGSHFIDKLITGFGKLAFTPQTTITVSGVLDRREQQTYGQAFFELLTDPNMKRMLFDSRQALVFAQENQALPDSILRTIRTPFDRFYLEFTEPIELFEQEPGERDSLRAFTFEKINYGRMGKLTAFLLAANGTDTATRFYLVDLNGLQSFVSIPSATAHEDGSEIPEEAIVDVRKSYPEAGEDWPVGDARLFFPAGLDSETRRMGFYERAGIEYVNLFGWLMAYTMAKSMEVIEAPMARQERRRVERMKFRPQPWHIVRVKPRFYEPREGESGEGPHHSYRYDVIGHLRIGRHPRKDGTFNETIEWVSSHQRGLRNALYIPKTYAVDGKKEVSGRMKEVWGDIPEAMK